MTPTGAEGEASKPNDIPQGIWDRSSMLWGHEPRVGIARAIMSEQQSFHEMEVALRECANVLDSYVRPSPNASVLNGWANGVAAEAKARRALESRG